MGALESVLDEEGAVVVGGQALVLLSELLHIDEGIVATKDIDLVGGKRLVKRCAEVLGGKATYAGADDITPHAGFVLFTDSQGVKRQLDILSTLYTINGDEVREHAIPVGDILILHPVAVLRDKAAQLGRLRSDEIVIGQTRVAVRAVRLFGLMLLDEDDVDAADRWDQVKRMNSALFKLARSKDGKRIFRDYGIDVLDGLVEDHPLIPKKTREIEYPWRRESILRARAH